MRKNNSWITIVLIILVGLSFGASYFILYDMAAFERWIERNETSMADTAPMDTGDVHPLSYMHPTSLSFQDIIKADNFIVRLGQQTYIIQDKATITTIRNLLESRPMEVDDVAMVEDEGVVNNLLDVDHLQLEFSTRIPLGTLTRILNIESDSEGDILIDRIIIPFTSYEEGSVYLVDSTTNYYAQATLSTNLKRDELRNAVALDKSDLMRVLRYKGAKKPIYLPVDKPTLYSALFVLDTIRENIYINDIFINSDSNTTEVSRSGETIFRYQNYINTLEVNRSRQSFNLSIGRAEASDARSTVEKYQNAFSMVKDYEYWDGDIRLFSSVSNYLTFRRYYNNLPILTRSGVTEYGAAIVQLRGDASGDIYRYYQPMVTFYTHIDTVTQSYSLANNEELVDLLTDSGYPIDGFEDIFIGYEWQEDMEGFKMAELIPTWFFQLGSRFYTLDEVLSDAFISTWHEYQDLQSTSSRGGLN